MVQVHFWFCSPPEIVQSSNCLLGCGLAPGGLTARFSKKKKLIQLKFSKNTQILCWFGHVTLLRSGPCTFYILLTPWNSTIIESSLRLRRGARQADCVFRGKKINTAKIFKKCANIMLIRACYISEKWSMYFSYCKL